MGCFIFNHQVMGNEGVTSVNKEGFYKGYQKFSYIYNTATFKKTFKKST